MSMLKEKDMCALTLAEKKVRMVKHKGIEKEALERVIAAIEYV